MIEIDPKYIALQEGQTAPLAHYSYALDEIYELRALLANEADILEAHLGYKTFPKSRRKFAEQQVERMRAAARGETPDLPERYSAKRALNSAGALECLTRHQWEVQRGLIEEFQ